MGHAKILSIASYLPGDPITNEHIGDWIGELDEELLNQVSIENRYWVLDYSSGEIRETNSEISTKAAKIALERANVSAEDIDLIIVSTCSPDYPLPATSTLVQDKLGIRKAATVDIRSGCCGAIQALDLAKLYLSSGQYQTALVIGTEVISPLLYATSKTRQKGEHRLRDMMSMYSFGDGSVALVLKGNDTSEGSLLGKSSIACVGGGKKPGMMVPLGGTANHVTSEALEKGLLSLKVDFTASAKYTADILFEALSDTLRSTGMSPNDIDLCIIPEGNTGYLREELDKSANVTSDWKNMKDKVYDNLSIVGNTGSPAVLLAFEHAVRTGKIKQGQNVMLLAIETSKWLFGGTVLEWQGV